ncbi:hypothetical protein Bhyg_15270 [Pseudolycoriella hygida]|uniref:Uncharacterized protein n=1 Tax=Pseudolycoriella hygida TaxID=35572 RepID=A0A9Q0MRJ2_9DIPT|nr:hypothetical protein Bhyg_15270 [Pseudolycoriella hygida]
MEQLSSTSLILAMKFLISSFLLVLIVSAVESFPGNRQQNYSDQHEQARTLNVNAFDILGLFGKRGGFLRPIIQNTIGNGNVMSLQTGITLLNHLFNGFAETGGTNNKNEGSLVSNFV